jgi:hypothetical protein
MIDCEQWYEIAPSVELGCFIERSARREVGCVHTSPMHIARRTFSFSMSHPSREWVGLSFRKNDFPKAPLRMRATIWLFVRKKSQVNVK